jgi:5-methylthioadenosine/S-adenosylhomocysteine deaminase
MHRQISCDILIEHTSCLTGDFEIRDDQTIVIKDGLIHAILPSDDDTIHSYIPTTRINGKERLWMPGLIDSHIHTGQQLLKGMVLDELPMIWTRIMLPFESSLTPRKMELSAELASLEMLKNGTTGFIESGSYFMKAAAKVYAKSKLRGALSHSSMDQGDFPDSIRQTTDAVLASSDALYDAFHGQGNLKVFYSLRALMNCSSDLIARTSARACERNTFFQAHMNEYAGEVNYSLEHFGLRPVEYLDSLHALNDRFLAIHGIMLSAHEMDLLAHFNVKMAHCPFSNCGKGVPDTPALLERDITVGLGSDGTAHGGLSLWNEMKIFRSVINACLGTRISDPAIMPAKTILKMATANGAALLNEQGSLGCLKAGYKADLISLDWNQPHLLATRNRLHTLFESASGQDVRDSIIGGEFVMKDRQILTLDEEQILWKAKKYFETNEVTT